MSLPLLRSLRPSCSKDVFKNVSHAQVRYARKKAEYTDTKSDTIRHVLYPTNIRYKATPIGSWRPDVARALQRAVPSKQAHETIERAWLLHNRHVRKRRDAESERKWKCIRDAMAQLKVLREELYKEANRPDDPRALTEEHKALLKTARGGEKKALEGRLPGLFPREMRVPTDTRPRAGWNYEWDPTQLSNI